MVKSTFQQTIFRLLLSCLRNLADQGTRPPPWFRCIFVVLLRSPTPQLIPLGATRLSRTFRRVGWTRLRRCRPQPRVSKGCDFWDLPGVRNSFEVYTDCHSAISCFQWTAFSLSPSQLLHCIRRLGLFSKCPSLGNVDFRAACLSSHAAADVVDLFSHELAALATSATCRVAGKAPLADGGIVNLYLVHLPSS